MSTTSSSSKSSKGSGGASRQPLKKARKPNGQSKSKKECKISDISAEANPEENPTNNDPKIHDSSAETGPKTGPEGEISTEADSQLLNGALVLTLSPEDNSTEDSTKDSTKDDFTGDPTKDLTTGDSIGDDSTKDDSTKDNSAGDDPTKLPLSITESSDFEWQPVSAGRIRKSNRPKKELHSLPPLKIGSADAPNAPLTKFEERQKIDSEAPFEQEEFNAHINEKLRGFTTRRGGAAPLGMTRGIPKNVLVERFETESTDTYKAEWRKRPEVPTTEELMRDVVDLPMNVIDGPYRSVDEYLETHYELLREDAFSGLRDAVGHMRKAPESDDTQDVAIYENVRILGLTFSNIGVASKVSFSINRAGKNIRWGYSKRLIPGTLVCLSSDNFKTVKVATVAARPMCGLELNPPEVDLLFNESEVEIDTEKVHIMVESRNGYFEAYKWTLRALQRMRADNFALHEHLCFLSDDVPPPAYVVKKPVFNMSSIFPDNPDKEALEDVNVIRAWPHDAQTSMDKSQMTALQSILTRELSIVQGPPGTGKTYISVLALRILLGNMIEGDPPIVVACQTNHALDQLLRHVQKYESEFVRLGGRTADRDKIKERTIFELRKNAHINIQGSKYSSANANMKRHRDAMMKLLEPLKQELLTPGDFFSLKLITEEQARSFTQRTAGWVVVADDDNQVGGFMGQWLGDYFVGIQVPEALEHEYEESDIEYERLKEMEAEFLSGGATGEEVDDRLKGLWFGMGREHTVLEPIGVSLAEIQSALSVRNMWDLEDHLRAAVYHHLRSKVIARTWDKVRSLNKQYQKCCQDLRIAKLEKDAHIIAGAKLVGVTTTGLGKYRSIIAAVGPKIVLIEEAAEALEGPVAVACMPGVEHLILVGDHKQLRGHCSVNDLQGEPYFLDISMFERLVTNDFPFVTLKTQRRMRPEIREILTPIYQDKLVDHASVLGRESIQGMGDTNVFWYSHKYPESTDDVHSRVNVLEADMIVNFADYLILNGMLPTEITILTFYAGQRTQILKTIRKSANLGQTMLKVATVDSYQGEENEVILLSLVRSNAYNSIGFLSIENRVCVALSRARRGFYIFGDVTMITAADKLWWEVGSILNEPPSRIGTSLPLTCQRHKARTLIEGVFSPLQKKLFRGDLTSRGGIDTLDWIDINGGCRKWCKETLPCRHVCTLRCHAFEHKEIRCISKCTKFLACGHQCVDRLCCEECVCQKCGRGQKAIEEAPTNTPTRSIAGVGSGGRTKAIQEAPTPPPPVDNAPVVATGKRQFENQLSHPDVANTQPASKLVEIDEWEAALPCNQEQRPVMTDHEQFPNMAVVKRNQVTDRSHNAPPPPAPPPPPPAPPPAPAPTPAPAPAPAPRPRYAASNYYGDNDETPVSSGGDMPAKEGAYGVPRRQLKGRWPDEDENGQVIDDRVSRGEYGPENNREGYGQQSNNYPQQSSGYGQQSNYSQPSNRGGYYQESNREGYSQQGNIGSYYQESNRGEYSQRGGREGYSSESNRGEYGHRSDRGGYNSEIRGEYSQRGDRGGYNLESRGEYSQRGDRGGYNSESRGEYSQRGDRGDYAPENSRGEYGQRGGYTPDNSRGGYSQMVDRGGYAHRGDRGGYLAQERRINEAWPVLGEARGGGVGVGGGVGRGYPNNVSRGQDPRQTGPWVGNNNSIRGPPGNGQTWGPVVGDRGQHGSWGVRGKVVRAPSYTQYR